MEPTVLSRGRRILREGVGGAEDEGFKVAVEAGGGIREREGVRTLRLRVTLFSFSSWSIFRSFALSDAFGR